MTTSTSYAGSRVSYAPPPVSQQRTQYFQASDTSTTYPQQRQQLPRSDSLLHAAWTPPVYTEPPILSLATVTNGIPVPVRAFNLTDIFGFLYVSTLFYLPFFYRTRVYQLLGDVLLTEKEIASRHAGGPQADSPRWRPEHWGEVKRSWSTFIDSTLKEWNALNIVSVLLLS